MKNYSLEDTSQSSRFNMPPTAWSNGMETLKSYLLRNFEAVFVLSILLSTAAIIYFVPYKLAFLNFYYIPIFLCAYYLGTRSAIMGAFFAIISVVIYSYLFPKAFLGGVYSEQAGYLDLGLNILTWGSFLILAGATVGHLNNQLKDETRRALLLSHELSEQKEELETNAQALQEHKQNLEVKVRERTEKLQRSKEAIEDLKKKVEDALYSTMDHSVVKLMIERRLTTEKREISILLCDLQRFTRYSEERRPEVVVTELNRYFKEMEGILLDYQAHIDKYMGDAILAEFGAPINHARHALMAVVAGVKMQESCERGNYPWQMRIAITTGEAIIGLIGHKRQSYTALGDVVNVASRVEKLCVPGKVIIDEATYDQIKEIFDVERKSGVALNGSVNLLPDPIAELSEQLEKDPDNFELVKKMGLLLRDTDDAVQAQEFLKRASKMAPDDTEVKLAYAEVSMKIEDTSHFSLRGKKKRIKLYEVIGLKNPLLDRDKIPQSLHDRYIESIDRLVPYPQDLILPVECLDGSVGHSRLVGFLAYAVADTFQIPDAEKKHILEAGYLADIGKTIVPHHQLNRAEYYNEIEFEEFAKHTGESVRRLKQLGYDCQYTFDIIAAHHENFNGTGFPNNLAGEAIPLGARIIAVVDAYASLTSWRPFRDRWDARAAFAELEKETSRGKFDPHIFKTLGQLLEIPA